MSIEPIEGAYRDSMKVSQSPEDLIQLLVESCVTKIGEGRVELLDEVVHQVAVQLGACPVGCDSCMKL